MVTMWAGLCEPFVFHSLVLWLDREVDTCLEPVGGGSYHAVDRAQSLASTQLWTGHR